MAPSLESIAQSAERLRGSWIAQHPWLLASIAILLALVLGIVVGDIRRGREADGNLKLARGWEKAYHRDIAATEKQFTERLEKQEGRTKSADAKYQALIENVLAANKISQKPWDPPKNTREVEGRFRALGYVAVSK